MPNPLFMPVIGSGFGDVMNQQAGWARFNAGVEEGNRTALGNAQMTRNNWLKQIQQLQQNQADRQYDSDLQSQQNAEAAAYRAQQDAEKRRQFDINSGLDRESLFQKSRSEKAAQDAEDFTVANVAKTLAQSANEYGSSESEAQKAFDEAQRTLNTKVATTQGEITSGKVVFSPRAKMFVPADAFLNDLEAQSIAANANLKVATAKANYDSAASELQTHKARFSDLQKQAQLSGLLVPRVGNGYKILDPRTGKFYESMKNPEPVETPVEEFQTTPRSQWFGGGATETGTGGVTWPGFSMQEAAASEPAKTVKIGRFAVTPAQ